MSAAGLSGMTAAALEISYLDPVIPDKKTYLLRPGHVDMEVGEEGSKAWSSLSTRKNSLFSIHTLKSFAGALEL